MNSLGSFIENELTTLAEGDGPKEKPETVKEFEKGVKESDKFARLMLAVAMETLQRAAASLTSCDSQEDAIELIKVPSMNRPIREMAGIMFSLGRKYEQTQQMDKMFGLENGSMTEAIAGGLDSDNDC